MRIMMTSVPQDTAIMQPHDNQETVPVVHDTKAYPTGGRCWIHGRASSKAAEAANTVDSAP